MIAIIDYGMGNLRSVENKIGRIGYDALITSNPEKVVTATKLILPGVGHFGKAVKKLKEGGLWDVLQERVIKDQIPILGICLGMQLMASHSEEGDCEGLGWFDAEVIHFAASDPLKYKVPHIGWNGVNGTNENGIYHSLSCSSSFYFVHSYHVKCNDPSDILSTTVYDYEFVSAIQKGNIYGTQFHPEKSHDCGEQLLKNFLSI